MFIIWICKYYSFKRGFPVKKNWKVVLKSEKKSAYMNTYFLVRHNNHIATWHQITRESEFGQKTVEVADWSISWKTKIWYEMILIFYENAAPIYCLLSTVWGASDILLTKSKDRRLYTTTRSYFRSSRVHNHCSSLFKKISQSLCISKKTFFERLNNIYTILIIVFHEHWVRNHFICVKEAMENLLNFWTLTIAFDQIESIWDDAEI